MVLHCLFEQSGTFKNEFIKLGGVAYDYDIVNYSCETDYLCDLFDEIHNCYLGKSSIFDNIIADDYVIAFFPCVRFSGQCRMFFTGDNYAQRKWSDIKKLEYAISLHRELDKYYSLISELVIVALKRGFKLIIENPYAPKHSALNYLNLYWCIKPKFIDLNRRERGDKYVKPTQFWFINCEPKNNFIFEGTTVYPSVDLKHVTNKVERSSISCEYANRFIREFIL